jgi:hypothetical protein
MIRPIEFQNESAWKELLFFIIIISGVGLSPLGAAAISGLLYKPQMIVRVIVDQLVE